MLKARLQFGMLMLAAAIAILVADLRFAPTYPLSILLFVPVGWIAAGELCALLHCRSIPVSTRFAQVCTVIILLSNWVSHLPFANQPQAPNISIPMGVFTFVGMAIFLHAAWLFDSPGKSVDRIAGHLLVVFYIGVLGSFLVQTRWLGSRPEEGLIALGLSMFTAKFCDIGAYFTGRAFGRTKLAPRLSPGKTLEGSIGGLLLAIALAFTVVNMGNWATDSDSQFLDPLEILLVAIVLALAGQLGDLMESLIKRDCQQKDASNNIPGFGGLLDVVDSVLFSGPVALILLWTLV